MTMAILPETSMIMLAVWAEVEREELMRAAAASATASMFPWERRQMDGGGKVNTFEKVYWAAFGCAIVYLVVVNGWRYYSKRQEPKVRVPHCSR